MLDIWVVTYPESMGNAWSKQTHEVNILFP